MLFDNKFKKAKQEILASEAVLDDEEEVVISAKVAKKEQLFSEYDYDANEKINPEFAEYIVDKAKFVPARKDFKIKIFSGEELKEAEIKQALKNHFKKEYLEANSESKRNSIFSLSMFVLGLLSMTLLFLSYRFFPNVYVETIIEIATWVFMWEAVDLFFLERVKLKRKRAIMLKLFMSEVEVVKIPSKKDTKNA